MRLSAWMPAAGLILLLPGGTAGAQQARVATSANGETGQRVTRDQDGTAPLERISSRIQNRVQSRIRNRIDRFYDPEANATSPFATASEVTRTAGTVRR